MVPLLLSALLLSCVGFVLCLPARGSSGKACVPSGPSLSSLFSLWPPKRTQGMALAHLPSAGSNRQQMGLSVHLKLSSGPSQANSGTNQQTSQACTFQTRAAPSHLNLQSRLTKLSIWFLFIWLQTLTGSWVVGGGEGYFFGNFPTPSPAYLTTVTQLQAASGLCCMVHSGRWVRPCSSMPRSRRLGYKVFFLVAKAQGPGPGFLWSLGFRGEAVQGAAR